jgi:hypothetical protein
MEILDLNDDVLDIILSCVGKQDLVNLMGTCYTMYDLAIPYLLTSVDLRRHVKQIFEFCQFVLKPPGEHVRGRGAGGGRDRDLPSLIRTLRMVDGATIPDTDPPFSTTLEFGDYLARVLEQTINLKELHIENVEFLIVYDPRICEAIVRLPVLSSIFFTGACQKSFDMISRMRDLRHVHVQHVSDLIPVIRPFQSTLESVSSEYKHWRNFTDLQSLSDTDQWPHVRSLKLGVINVRSYRLVHAFPNLRALRLQGGVPSAKDEALEKGPKRCWSNLDYVEGLVVELYQAALNCPIRELRFNNPPASLRSLLPHASTAGPFGPPAMFLDIIRTAGPTALSFPVSQTMQDESFFRQLADLLPHLKVLGLLVDFDPTKTLSHLVSTQYHIFSILFLIHF